MKNWNDCTRTLKMELDQWFIRQCQNTHQRYYLYYQEANAEHDGGFSFCSEDPPNKDYKLATTEHIRRDLTVEQNFNRLLPVIAKLPILS